MQKYLGLDVHSKRTVWCLLDSTGQVVGRGKIETTAAELSKLCGRLSADAELLAGQECGKLSYFVYDIVTAAGVNLLSFNAYQLRMIASSRKKTDRRDAYWIAKALQTGMMPHPVYIPTGLVRQLRGLLATRTALVSERTRWSVRAKGTLMAAGCSNSKRLSSIPWRERALAAPEGIDDYLADRLDLCDRAGANVARELKHVEAQIRQLTKGNDDIARLQTIPAVGERVAVTLYAWIGDVSRFPNARVLASYAGLVPTVRQSGTEQRNGRISKEGSKQLRSMLVQAGHVLLWRCDSEHAAPLRALALRVQTGRGRRKIAVVAAARHILRIAYYVLRDGTNYNPALLTSAKEVQQLAS